MHKNNNTVAVKRLAERSSKANRTRNIVTIVAIVLTTFMISTVFSIGVSFAKNYDTMRIRTMGTSANMFLGKPSSQQVDVIKKTEGIDSTAEQIKIGKIPYETAKDEYRYMGLAYYDETGFQDHFSPAIDNIVGTYPQGENEIMMSKAGLKSLGIDNPQIGAGVKLIINIGGIERQGTYKLCGWFTNFKELNSGGYPIALGSKALCDKYGLSMEKNGGIEIKANHNYQAIYDELESKLDLRHGQELQSTFESEEESSSTQMMAIIMIAMIGLFIVLSGYLLIYNIIYISVSRDTRFYGMLKTIGTSPSQIRKIVKRQITKLSLIGIPLGLGLGAAASFLVVPQAMSIFQNDSGVYSALPGDISFNPLIFIGAAIFALITVVISCRKPARLAGKISPIEAMKYTGMEDASLKKKKVKDRKSTDGGKLHKLAYHNIFREKKRAMLVFASLFMGIITMLTVSSFLGSLSVDNFIDWYQKEDFSYQQITGKNLTDENFIDNIRSIDGITSMDIVREAHTEIKFDEEVLKPVIEDGYKWVAANSEETYEDYVEGLRNSEEYGTNIYNLDTKYIEQYNDKHQDDGKAIDIDAFKRGDEVILLGEEYADVVGKNITMTGLDGKANITKKVSGAISSDDAHTANSFYTVGAPEGIFVSENFIKKYKEEAKLDISVFVININVEEAKEPQIKAALQQLNARLSSDGEYVYEEKTTEAKDFQTTMTTMKVMTSGISGLLIVIGIINFINVMLTGVYARRRELAVMESVGMTKKQIKKMLTFEGLYYAIITLLITMTIGNAILYWLSGSITTIADYAVFQYPVVLVVAITLLLLVICMVVPRIVYNKFSKESITERLREAE